MPHDVETVGTLKSVGWFVTDPDKGNSMNHIIIPNIEITISRKQLTCTDFNVVNNQICTYGSLCGES